jgi:hypothetical protein
MSILALINAPLGVQLNRTAFTINAASFTWPLWSFRHSISVSGVVVFSSFVFLQFAVALDSGCTRSGDSCGVLDTHVLDGIQPASLVGGAFGYRVCAGGLVWFSDFLCGMTFSRQKDP